MRTAAVITTLTLAAALSAAPTPAGAAEDRGRAAPPPEPQLAAGIVVELREDARPDLVRAAVAADIGAEVTRVPVLRGVTALQTAELMSLADAEALAREVARRPDVLWAAPNTLARPDDEPDVASPSPVNDPLFGQLYNIWDLRDASHPEVSSVAPTPWPAGGYSTKAPALWRSTRGEGVVLAVVDTGIRPHADLVSSILPGIDTIENPLISNDGDGRDVDASDPGDWVPAAYCSPTDFAEDSSWHGTHVAGTAAAPANNALGVAGVAPGVRILPIRSLGRCGGTRADIAAGIAWAAGVSVPGLPANPTPAAVINMSLGGNGPCDPTYQTAIDAARAQGATVVVSAGNDNFDAVNKSPANCNGVVVTGSVSEYGDKAAYSNFGATVDISAPGGDNLWDGRSVLSTYNAGTTVPGADSYGELQGTSMAAPAAAGGAALLASIGRFTPDQLEAAMKTAVTPFPTSFTSGWAQCQVNVCGTGILDLGLVPAPVTPPAIAGSGRAGSTVTAVPGVWTGPAVPLAYAWLSDGEVVGTGSSYEIESPGDLTLRVGPATGAFTPIVRDSAVLTPTGKTSKVKLKAPKKIRKGVRARVNVVVKVKGTKKPKGKITIYDGKKVVGKAAVKAKAKGRITIRLKRLGSGKHELTAFFDGKVGVFDDTSKAVKVKVPKG